MNKRTPVKHAVVIVNYQNPKDTIECVRSVLAAKDAPLVIVVDNGSSQQHVAQIQTSLPSVTLIKNSANVGFSAANNQGIKRALSYGAKVVYLLNNDTTVDPNLFFRAYRHSVGKNQIVGGKIYYSQGYEYHSSQKNHGNIIWYAGGEFDFSMAISTHFGIDQPDQGQFDSPKEVSFVTGCFMVLPRRVIVKNGLLDEKFFLYLEDSEYCLRAIKNGIKLIYNPRLVLYHKNGASSGAASRLVDYYMTRNRLYIAGRYGSWRLRLALFREDIKQLSNPVRRQALFDYLTGQMGNRNSQINQLASPNS